MKTLTTMTAIAALLAGISFANAQNSGNTPSNSAPPPSSINSKATDTTSAKSGSESSGAVEMKAKSAQQGQATQNNVPPNSLNAKMPDTQSNKSGGQAANPKAGASTTGMNSDSKANANVSPSSINAKEPDTNTNKSGSQPTSTAK